MMDGIEGTEEKGIKDKFKVSGQSNPKDRVGIYQGGEDFSSSRLAVLGEGASL